MLPFPSHVEHPSHTTRITANPIGDSALLAQSQRIAQQFGLSWTESPSPDQPRLVLSPDGLAWHPADRGQPNLPNEKPVCSTIDRFDVDSPAARSLSQPIAKAAGLARRPKRELVVLDATAGWAEDAYLLAALGCRVHAAERNPMVAALVTDGLRRASAVHRSVVEKLDYGWNTGQNLLAHPPATPVDVVYLDPMFPDDPKRTALAKKPLRWLKEQVGDDDDAGKLFELARAAAPKRIVVKRPIKAPAIHPGAPTATMVFQGRGFRFDVYVFASI